MRSKEEKLTVTDKEIGIGAEVMKWKKVSNWGGSLIKMRGCYL